ncbi:MAG: ATP-dependent DNA helicase RecG [Candidatus Nealsonbacteria bacterium]|nr:ATP-dependent DNA helicase RecG [Candidatus Nealsonbacteria bacterium]
MNLTTPIGQIAGIGPVFQKKLKKLGIKNIQDLLFHFPHRYEDFSNVTPISKIKFSENCCVQGKILEIETSRTWKKKIFITQAIVQDNTGAIKALWFNQPYLSKILKAGDSVYLAGKTSLDKQGVYLSNPAYEKLVEARLQPTHMGRIVPVYPETEGLSSRWLRNIIQPILINFRNSIPDLLPQKIIQENQLLPFSQAIWQIHFPDSPELANKAKERFSFEELFFIELWVLRERAKLSQEKANQVTLNLEIMQKLVKSLPFKLTDAQKKSAWAILKDLEKSRPMNRLLEGDVGSGKTVVAALAALNVIKAGYQAAFMAPTEILANQHFKTIWDILKNFNINVGLLTGKTDKFFSRKLKNDWIEVSRKKLLEKTLKGEMNLVIGTHALIQDKIKFGKLALVIVDEQHRFGVEQRARLLNVRRPTSNIPHLLSMTATPIPRTLALTLYGDLDLSLIDQLPKGRKKIITKIVSPEERRKTYDFIREEIKNGRQAFVICPRIESKALCEAGLHTTPSSWAGVKAVEEEYEKLSKEIFPDLSVAMLHGKMPGLEKERTMQNFKNKKIDILVSTSVVEVGVDVPNASVMMIEGADRFGLAQLHQFRGRVGRSIYQSYCFLLTDSPSGKTNLRLKALVNCENSFELAEKDLEIRGPGDFTGTRQWGIPDLIMGSLRNVFLVEKTRNAAKEILMQDPLLKNYPLFRERLSRFREKIHLE